MKYGIYTLIIENHFKRIPGYSFDFGWGCGYVLIPEGHPFYGVNYDEINDYPNISVHGGLTYGSIFESKYFTSLFKDREVGGDVTLDNYEMFNNYWMIGFDTNHSGDSLSRCPKYYVLNEAHSLLEQCLCDDIDNIKKYKNKIDRRNKLNRIENI
jgi:hypothetical protein